MKAKGIIGQPKFQREELVSFTVTMDGQPLTIDGAVYIVDAYGTFEQKEEPSYDIEAVYQGEITLFKHIRESFVTKRGE